MHNRRQKEKRISPSPSRSPQISADPADPDPPLQTKESLLEVNLLTPLTNIPPEQAAQMRECVQRAEKYDLERFINPTTREETFRLLFTECDKLWHDTEHLRTVFFDSHGNFLSHKYHYQTQSVLAQLPPPSTSTGSGGKWKY